MNIFIYAHLINVFILIVIVRNDKSVLVKIFKNFRFERMSKIDFLNVFQIDNCEKNVRKLIVKHRKFSYQDSWFKKFISVYATTYVVVVAVKIVVNVNLFVTTSLTIFFVINMNVIVVSIISIFLTIFFIVFIVQIDIKKLFVDDIENFFINRQPFANEINIDRKSFANEININEKSFANSIFSKIILFNEVIIYNFDVVNFFVKIIQNFSVF